MEEIRAKVLISGKVQSVFFREHTKREALELELKGYVKNLENGDVEAVFQGPENKIREIILWCKDGPKLSKVKNVQIRHMKPKEEFTTFEIIQ
jgi:acylphosphatase|tara:strand:+ start:1407 stop:1685 length:279 start_codon:yes stop_codon:yes gene_type:complete